MSKVYVFPGQRAQLVGMGKEFYNRNIHAQLFFNKDNEMLGHICNWLFEVIFLLVFFSCSGDIEATEALEIGSVPETPNSNKVVVWGHSAGVIIEPFIKHYLVDALGPDIEFEPCSVIVKRCFKLLHARDLFHHFSIVLIVLKQIMAIL